MAKSKIISINLLPPEFMAEKIKTAKFYKIQTIGVVIILVMIFLSSLTVSLRILQSSDIKRVQSRLSQTEERVVALKGRQASLVVLKNRLTTISKNIEETSKQASMYNLLDKLIPQSISITSLAVDKAGNAAIVALVPDSNVLDSLILGLTSDQEVIKQVSIESLNRSREGVYRTSLKVSVK